MLFLFIISILSKNTHTYYINNGKKNKVTVDYFVLKHHLTNIVVEVEIQNCKYVLALDRDSHSDRSKKLDIRNHFGFGQKHICDYMPFNEDTKKIYFN